VKRRKVIKHLGLGLSAGLALPGWITSCKSDDPVPVPGYEGKIGIIGAGAAGLYLADILKAQGIQVILFEASDRLGGRVRTLKSTDNPSASLIFNSTTPLSSDFPNELGAGLVLGSDSSWGKIIEQLHISTVNLGATGVDSYFLDGALADSVTAEADADFIAAKNFVDNLASYTGGNVSVQDAVAAAGISARMFAIVNSWIGNKYCTTDQLVGIQALAEDMQLLTRNNELLTLTDNPMQDALLSRFSNVVDDVELNAVVKEIDYTGDKIVVSGERTLSAETFSVELDKVVVTVPLTILKDGSINFMPALGSTKNSALSRMGMDAAMRVLLDFKANFWGDTTAFVYGGNTAPEYFGGGLGRSEVNRTLAVTIGGPQAEGLSPLGKNAIQVLIDELDSIFDGKASLYIRKDANDNNIAIIQDWFLEPFVKGGMSYVKPGGTHQDRVDLAQPIDGKLFFAGEATDVSGEAGTLNGALLSAKRASLEVLDSI